MQGNNSDYPDAWDKNREAGTDWHYGLMKRNPNLRPRMSEATRIARDTAFHRYNVDTFFWHYDSIINRPNFKLEPRRICNWDETGVKTVQGPSKIMSEVSPASRTYYLGRKRPKQKRHPSNVDFAMTNLLSELLNY